MITKHIGNPAWVTLSPLWVFLSVSPLKTNRTRHPATPEQIKTYFPLEHSTIDTLHCCKPAPARVCRHCRHTGPWWRPSAPRREPCPTPLLQAAHLPLRGKSMDEGSQSPQQCHPVTKPLPLFLQYLFFYKSSVLKQREQEKSGNLVFRTSWHFCCIPRGAKGRNAGQWEDKCVSWQ